ncbi:hypothetical protein [Sphingobium sp. AntQ-1]|uniref:hypothetical protein n=1 Tax=Sphingobium sp. AntQ-1 TaxID=2930091 RepID=UPI00234E7C35|nr:hypothetical protein [Sphingobium sp. AntQ-1]
MPPFNIHQAAAHYIKELQRRYCSHANAAGQPCGGQIVRAHTVQKSGGLEAIARDSRVYSLTTTMPEMVKNRGRLVPRLVGIGQASVFPGFCAEHDRDLFLPIEGKDCAIGEAEALLFSYRAVCFEAYSKRAQLAASDILFRLDEGSPVEDHELAQNMARNVQHSARRSAAATHARKEAYEARLAAQDFTGYSYSWTRFDGLLPVACCGTFLPDNDLTGTLLQRIAHGTQAFEHVTLNITSFAGQSVIVFGWTGDEDGPAARFVQSFDALDDQLKAAAATRLALEYLENSYISPVWWEALAESDRRGLISHDAARSVYQRRPAITRALGQPIATVTASVVARGGRAAGTI